MTTSPLGLPGHDATSSEDGSTPHTARVFRVPEDNMGALRRSFERLNRRAEKLGLTPISWTEGAPVTIPHEYDRLGAVISWTLAIPVTVQAVPLVLDGWTLAAVLQQEGDDVVTRRVPGSTLDLTPFRTVDATWCEHCETSRRRNETFVVVHEDGATKRVGRQCLKDFLGHTSAYMLASSAEFLLDVMALAEDAEERGAGAGGTAYPATAPFLALVAVMIRTHGWTPRSSTSGATPTVDHALTVYWTKDKKLRAAFEPTAEDTATAEAARAWALEAFGEKPVEDRTDYEHNAWLSIRSEAIGRRQTGIAASVVPAHLRHLEQLKLQQAAPPLDAWLATERERLTFYGHLLFTKVIEGTFGATVLHRIRTREGHTVVWFSSGEKLCDDQGERLFTATVKRHDTRQGEKQTIVSRLVEARDEAREKLEHKLQQNTDSRPRPRKSTRKAA